jgi:hypothetical protein
MGPRLFSKQDLSREVGAAVQTWNYWISRGILAEPTVKRPDSVRLFYTEAQAKKLVAKWANRPKYKRYVRKMK